ncbi:glycoside hydrolase family 11 protein [Sorangium cellulosum]|uniref:glycoside hydrolase family 11 protein n=1 Tax=Sorangium cellulosum TaxID=56 RepID=UPI001F25872C|nr:glycoside hydrolase family 11 protein [Sorangium cellulosum]
MGFVAMGCSGSDDSPAEAGSGGSAAGTGGTTTSSAATGGGTGSTGSSGGSGSATTGGTATGTTSTGTAAGGTGGSNGTGGSGGGESSSVSSGTPAACTEPDLSVCSDDIGVHCGLTYEYWKDRGDGCLVNKADGFSVEWSNINNLLGRKGVRPGGKDHVVTYEADYRPNGNSYLGVYGWTTSPLIEYYIIDSWGNWRPPGGEGLVGTVTSDGGTYDIYRTQRVNQPSIEGTATFYQFWSVRKEKRTSGTITVANHFDAWERQGLTLGTFYEVSLVVEGYQSNGSADVKVFIE